MDVIGISTVHGNASLKKTTNNALSVLEAIGKSNIPVHPGAEKPFCRHVETAPDIHGESGLDGTQLLPKPKRLPLTACNAVKDMRDALMSCPRGTGWLVATGTLTNISLLFATFPEVAPHIKGLSIMGGAIGDGFANVPVGPEYADVNGKLHPRIGNWTPFAEFNIWCDPEAAQSVLQNPVLKPKTTLIPLDVTHQAFANKQIQDTLLKSERFSTKEPTRLRKMFNELLMFFAHTYAEVFHLKEGPPLHDPLAVAVLLSDHSDSDTRIQFDDRDGERWDVNVILAGEQIGRTVAIPSKDGLRIPRTLDLVHFWKVLNHSMTAAEQATGLVD